MTAIKLKGFKAVIVITIQKIEVQNVPKEMNKKLNCFDLKI